MVVETKVRLLAARLRCPLCLGALESAEEPAARCGSCGTAYHAACTTELGVECATIGCARGPAYPAPRLVVHTAPLRIDVHAPTPGLLWPLVTTWVLFVTWPLALVAWGWALRRAWRRPRRARALTAALLLSPFVAFPLVAAARAVHGYATGTAVLEANRYTFVGLDPEVRCAQRHAGYFGGEPLTCATTELVLRGLARHIGPMPGGYDGPLPTAAEARALLAGPAVRLSSTQDSPEWGSERLVVVVDGRAVALELPWNLTAYAFGTGAQTSRPARFVPIDGRSFLVAALGDPDAALVCDVRTGRAVALVHFRASRQLFAR